MSEGSNHLSLHPTRIAIPLEIRAYATTMLNQTLAKTVDLRSQVKQAYWNVKGTDFSQLQALFKTIATELDTYADLVAERITVLGGVASGTVRIAAVQSMLPEHPGDLVESRAHVLALAECFASYATAMRADIAKATDVEEAATAAVYTHIARGIEKRLWGLEAHLHR
jgi:starvation-inducible DNA-binding protein